jgi:hypothetical protein
VLLALQREKLADPFLPPRTVIRQRRVRPDLPGDDAEDVDPAGERVGDGLEDEGRGAVALDAELDVLLGR